MHTNHRRRNKFRAKHHGILDYMFAHSLKWWRRQRAKDRRAEERELIAHERYDSLPRRYPRDIYWDYW